MEYENLGEISLDSEDEIHSLYEPDSGEKQDKASEDEVESAKAFLSIVDQTSKISLYDHLLSILRVVLRSKTANAVEEFEDISLALKRKRIELESEFTEVIPSDERLKKFIEDKKQFLKLEQQDIDELKSDEDEDDENEDDDDANQAEEKEEPNLCNVLPDLYCTIDRFKLSGIGLSSEETFELCLAMKKLAQNLKLHKVRFWGKMFTLKGCYYIVESPHQADVTTENFGWKYEVEVESHPKLSGSEDDNGDEDKSLEEEEKNEDESMEQNEEEDTENEAESPPPIPEPKQKKKKIIPAEEAGTGVNEHLYFVCSEIGKPWRCLPLLKPFHVVKARQLKRFLTGNLEDEIRGCVIFDGKEAHYLRAQIARISSCTFISPENFYTFHSETDEDEENEQEDDEHMKRNNEILKNEQYQTKSVKEMFSRGLEAWVHSRPAILDQGRCTPMMSQSEEEKEEEENATQDEKEEDAEGKEGDDEQENDRDEMEIFEAVRETSVPLLRTIAGDKAVGRLDPWLISLSSKMLVEKAIIILRSNLWPGAYTFFDGKLFDHIYIGYGFKYSVFHYAPPIYIPWQKEYKVGPEVIEHVDEPPTAQTEETNDQENSDEEAEENEKEEE